MKIAFVQPPNLQRSGDWKAMRVSRPPINVALLASYARQHGHEPLIYDFDWYEGTITDMAHTILSDDPDVVGFTCLTPRLEVTLLTASWVKTLKPDVKIVMGGAHVNGVKGRSLLEGIDYALYGEAEEALVELLGAIETNSGFENIQNLIYHQDGKVVVNPSRPFIQNLDELPLPAWDLLNLSDYTDPANFDGIHMGVNTSRGCPWNCIFCASNVTWGRKVRYHSVERVIEELEHIVHNLGIRNIMFYDDTFTLNKRRFLKICDEIVRRDLNLKYYCQLRVDTVDREIATALAKSGCIAAAIGVESGDNGILKILQKGIETWQVRRAVATLKEARVPILASYIIGSPEDTHETITKTLKLAKELDTDQTKFMICTPFPGTALFDMAVDRGLLSYDLTPAQFSGITYYGYIVANLSNVSDKELLQYQKDAYRSL